MFRAVIDCADLIGEADVVKSARKKFSAKGRTFNECRWRIEVVKTSVEMEAYFFKTIFGEEFKLLDRALSNFDLFGFK